MPTTLLEFKPLSADLRASSPSRPFFGVRNGHRIVSFDPGTDQECFFTAIMPEAYAADGVSVVLEFMFDNNTAANAEIGVSFERLEVGVTDLDADGFAAEKVSVIAVPGTSGFLVRATITFADGAEMDSIAASDQFRIRVRRNATNPADTANTAFAQLTLIRVSQTATGGGGGGGGFFTDGVGTDAGIGKGAVTPTADGSNSLAQGNGSSADGNNSLAVGQSCAADGLQACAIGRAIVGNARDNLFGQGYDQTFTYVDDSFAQGNNNDIVGDNFGSTGNAHFNQGTNNNLTHRFYYYYYNLGPYYYYYSQAGFVQGHGNTITGTEAGLFGTGAFGSMVQGCRNTMTDHVAASVLGNDNTILNATHCFAGGFSHYINTGVRSALFGADHYLLNGGNCSLFGYQHNMNQSGSVNISMFGDRHTMEASVNHASIFGTRGRARNTGALVHSGGNVNAQGDGRFQVSRISFSDRLNSATANQVLETFLIPNSGAFFLEVRVSVHYSSGTNEDAVFYYDGRILVNKAGGGTGNVQFTEFGMAPSTSAVSLAKIDAGGTNVGTLTMDIIPNGTTSFQLRATPPNTDLVYFNWEVYLNECNLA